MPCCTYIQCAPVPARSARCPVLALLFTSSGPIGSSRSPSVLLALLAVRAVRCARLPAPVCASADAWSTVDFFVRRPCVACLACPLSVCVWARACAWALSAYLPVACRAFHSPIMYILRRYDRLARRVSAPPQTFSRSFSSRRYLSRRRPRGWVARLYIAIRVDLGAW